MDVSKSSSGNSPPADAMSQGDALYSRENLLLRWWPPAVIGTALVQASIGLFGAAALCAALALKFAALIPGRFAVTPTGIALWLGLGKRKFLPRDEVFVECDRGGAKVRRRDSRHMGASRSPNGSGPSERAALLAALVECEFEITR